MNSYYEKILATGEVKCIDEEVPFEVPKGWEWCRLSALTTRFSTGPFGTMLHKEDYTDNGVAVINPTNIINHKISLNNIKQISLAKAKELQGYAVCKGDIILARRGDLRKSAIITDFEDSCIAGTGSFIFHLLGIVNSFFILFYSSPYVQDYLITDSIGTTMNNLNQKLLTRLLIPIPPRAEQVRIVSLVDELFSLVNTYDMMKNKLDFLNSSLHENIKKSILQEAIQGKLVPQIAEEGTAKELLEQIKIEKQKLVKEGKLKKSALNDSVIFRGDDNKYWEKNGESEYCIDDIVPFELPPTWCWVRHNQLFEISGGSQPPKSQFIERPQEGYIRLYQIRDYGNSPLPVFIPKEKASKITKKGDIILARYGASLGKVFFAEDGAYNVAMAKVIPQFPENLICKEFLFLFYKTSIYQKLVKDRSRCAQAGFNKEDLNDLLFPLPPLKEQHRIVERFKNVTSIMS